MPETEEPAFVLRVSLRRVRVHTGDGGTRRQAPRSDANLVPMAPYANVTNCGYLPTNRPDYNQAGPAWYCQPGDGAQNRVSYTLESIRRVHSQTHRLLRVSNHTATGIESLATLQGMQPVPLPELIKQTIELLTDSFNDLLPIVFDLEFKLRYMLRSGVIQFSMGPQTELLMSGQCLQQLLTASPGKSRTLFTANNDFRDEGPPDLTEQEQAVARTPSFLRELDHTLGGRQAVLGSIPVSAHSKQLTTVAGLMLVIVLSNCAGLYENGVTVNPASASSRLCARPMRRGTVAFLHIIKTVPRSGFNTRHRRHVRDSDYLLLCSWTAPRSRDQIL